MIIKIYPENPNPKQIAKVIEVLQKGGIVIYPTDSVYGIGCNIYNHKAIEKIAKIKGIAPDKSKFSIICHSLSEVSDYTRPINNQTFKLMKKNLPGPFTFILEANNKVPDIFQSNKKTVGIRIPDNPIVIEIVKELGNPILNTSVHDADEIIEYTTDPELIHEKYQDLVDIVIDGGYGQNTPTTIVDCTGDEPLIIREGIGELQF
jgi:tRNA threonylcarbamoyl adenosine modification protein (Sua5/YciO/YrdC/YwlC family)